MIGCDDEAYVHFAGVDPAHRGSGLGREVYERFLAAVAPRSVVRAVELAPGRYSLQCSIANHRALGMRVRLVAVR